MAAARISPLVAVVGVAVYAFATVALTWPLFRQPATTVLDAVSLYGPAGAELVQRGHDLASSDIGEQPNLEAVFLRQQSGDSRRVLHRRFERWQVAIIVVADDEGVVAPRIEVEVGGARAPGSAKQQQACQNAGKPAGT